MRVPIALALADGERLPGVAAPADLAAALAARTSGRSTRCASRRWGWPAGPGSGAAWSRAILNAANEVCVGAFLRGACRFDQITDLVGEAVEAAPAVAGPSLDDVLEADGWARRRVTEALALPAGAAVGGPGGGAGAALMGVLITIVAFLVLITIVVVVHEGGHYTLAKLSGIRVDEFFVGFGPRVVSFRRGDTEYGIRALPVGGFVRMPGMLGLEGEADAGERNFYRATVPRRLATIAAGVIFNLVFGALCLTVVAAQASPSYVPAGEPTARAGLVNGDVILSIGGSTISYASPTATDDDFYSRRAAEPGAAGRRDLPGHRRRRPHRDGHPRAGRLRLRAAQQLPQQPLRLTAGRDLRERRTRWGPAIPPASSATAAR